MTKQPVQPSVDDVASSTSSTGDDAVALLTQTIAKLERQVQMLKEDALRSQADYQNLVRRTREERAQFVQLALRECMQELVEPLEHLSMTAEQLKNPVLDMVVVQLWNKLKAQGLSELDVMGKPFSVETMEVVELTEGATEATGVVVKIVRRGYSLQGSVLQHAKVIIGLAS